MSRLAVQREKRRFEVERAIRTGGMDAATRRRLMRRFKCSPRTIARDVVAVHEALAGAAKELDKWTARGIGLAWLREVFMIAMRQEPSPNLKVALNATQTFIRLTGADEPLRLEVDLGVKLHEQNPAEWASRILAALPAVRAIVGDAAIAQALGWDLPKSIVDVPFTEGG